MILTFLKSDEETVMHEIFYIGNSTNLLFILTLQVTIRV